MSAEKVSAKEQAEAWKTLVSVLPVILSAENSKDHVKSNFGGIDKACTEFGQTPDAVFGRLKRMSSAIVRQAKHEKVQSNGDANEVDGISSDSSDGDQPLEFTKEAVKPKSNQPIKAAKGRNCDSCGGPISKNSKGLCKDCHNNRGGKRSCDSCGGPISSKSKGLCRDCHNNRGKLTSSKPIGPKKHKKGERDICVQCMEDRIIVEDGLCEGCYEESADIQVRQPNESANDEEVPSIRKASKKDSTDDEEASSDHDPPHKEKSIPAKIFKKSIASASTTKNLNRKTAKCMDCQAPVRPKTKRCMDCHKISLKAKSGDAKAKKEKVEEDQVKPVSSGKLKMVLKRSAVDIGRKSNESSKKRRMTYN